MVMPEFYILVCLILIIVNAILVFYIVHLWKENDKLKERRNAQRETICRLLRLMINDNERG